MDLGLYIAASGMVAEQVRQDQLSNDLANASTPGYKPDESSQHSFGDVLLANSEGGPQVGSVDEGVALGNTKLLAGTAVSIAQVADPFQGKYTLSRTRHVFDDEGYRTEFEITGMQDRSTLGLMSLGATNGSAASP